MKRNPIFIYNDIDKQNLIYANQLTVKQWNDIINKLTTQANANTSFLETWTRWFFGPIEYTTEDEYTDSLGAYDSYYDYLKAEFNRIDARITDESTRLDGRINEEIYNRESQDRILSNRIDINANDIIVEREQRVSQDLIIHDRINVVNQRVATEEDNRMAEIDRLEGIDSDIRDSIVQENINWNAADRNLQDQITDNKNSKLNSDLSNLPFASRVHNDDFLVIRCACDGEPATQKISIKVLAELINSEVDYFKGVFVDYDHLVDVWPVGEPGDYALVGSSDEPLFIQYVWDDAQLKWEETTSTQFVLPEVFSAHQQDLQEGKFIVGKSVISTTAESTSYYTDPDNPTMPKVDIKDLVPKPLEIEVRDEFSNAQGAGTMKEIVIGGDVWRVPSDVTSIIFSSLPTEDDSYELRTITINGEKWRIPEGSKPDSEPLPLELSGELQDGANELGSITLEGITWNVARLSDVLNKLVEFSNNANEYANTKDTETLNSAKAYTDSIKTAILGEDISETFDTLKEIQDWIENEGVEATELAQAVAGKQNKLTAGEGISISEDGVISVTFTAPVVEEWDGSYEEISSGYKLTLSNFDNVYYALGDSDDFTQITNETLVLNNVTTIKFKTQYYNSSSGGAAFYIKKNDSIILSIFSNIGTLTIEEDTTLTAEWGPFSGGGSD